MHRPLAFAVLFALPLVSVRATNYTWNGSGTTNAWSNTVNWTPAGIPGSADTITFSSTTGCSLNGSNRTVAAIDSGSANATVFNGAGTGNLTVQTITENSSGSLTFRSNSATSILNLSAANIAVASSTLSLGLASGAAGREINSLSGSPAVGLSGGTLDFNVVNNFVLGLISATGPASTIQLAANDDGVPIGTAPTVGGLAGSGALTIYGSGGTSPQAVTLTIADLGPTNYVSSAVLADTSVAGGTGTLALRVAASGSGAQTLTSASTFSGGTALVSGALYASNAAGSGLGTGSVATQGGSLLGGTGTLAPSAGNGLSIGGTLSPGDLANPEGALTLDLQSGSALTFNPGAEVAVTLGGSGNSAIVFSVPGDWLRGSGNWTLAISDPQQLMVPGVAYPVFCNVTTAGFAPGAVTYNGQAVASCTFTLVGGSYELVFDLAPSLSGQPLSQTASSGGTATFVVTASGAPSPVFQWLVSPDGGATWSALSDGPLNDGTVVAGSATPSLSLSNLSSDEDGDEFEVIVSNGVGSPVTSNPASLSVPPSIAAQPQPFTAAVGTPALFTVSAAGAPGMTYQWQVSIDGGATWTNLADGNGLSGSATATLSLAAVQASQDGSEYRVVTADAGGTVTSSAAGLTVVETDAPPQITAQPRSQMVDQGQTASFTVAAAGYPAPSYQWTFAGNPLAGATGATLTIADAQPANAGSYAVIVTNAEGSSTSVAVVLSVDAPPAIAGEPQSLTVTAGSTASFMVTAAGFPAPTYQWTFNGSPIPGATGATLAIANAQPANAGSYGVVVANPLGVVASDRVTLEVDTLPVFSTQPIAQSAGAGSVITFSAAATGIPVPGYQWLFNGAALANGVQMDGSVVSGAGTSTLTITGVTRAETGLYGVTATNSVGSVSSGASLLNVGSAITASLDPASQRAIPAHFYGDNGQDRGTFSWESAATSAQHPQLTFQSVLASLNLGLLRLPCGSGANYWDWAYGTFTTFDGYGAALYKGNNQWPSPLSELEQEVAYTQGALPVFVLNLYTDPTQGGQAPNGPIGQQVGALYPVGGPALALPITDQTVNQSSNPIYYQLNRTTGMIAEGQNLTANGQPTPLSLGFFELGNEYYFNNNYGAVYGSGSAYGAVASQWAQAINLAYPNVSVAAIAAYDYAGQPQNWNASAFSSAADPNPGNVTLHVYAQPNLPSGTVPIGSADPTDSTVSVAQDLIGSAFLACTKMNDFDFAGTPAPGGGSLGQQLPAGTKVWITEYNTYNDNSANGGITYYYDTWAQGLSLAAMSLKFLEQPQIQMLIHHCVVGSSAYGDIFENASGLSAVTGWSSGAPPTVLWGLSAAGVVSQQINTAAKGQISAQQLAFNSAAELAYMVPDYVDGKKASAITVPILYGWEFSGGAGRQIVILNLGSQDQSVDLSGVVAAGNCFQVTGDPAAYVTDGAYATAWSIGNVRDDLSISGPGTALANPAAFLLPKYSLTRIVVTSAPQAPAITSQPASVAGVEGSSVSFTVAASGAPAPVYRWEVSADGGASWSLMSDGNGVAGSATPTLTLGALAPGQSGNEYRVVASSAGGAAASAASTLTVEQTAPAVLITLGAPGAAFDGSAEATTATTSVAGLPLLWSYNGVPLAFAPLGDGLVEYGAAAGQTLYVQTTGASDGIVSGSGLGPYSLGSDLGTAAFDAGLLADGQSGVVAVTIAADGTTFTFAPTLPTSGFTLGPETAGTYDVTATVAASTYSGTISGTWTIAPAVLTVTAGPQNKVYGSSDPLFTYTVSGLQGTDTATAVLSGSLARAAGENVGNYAIGAGTLEVTANYSLNFVPSVLSITPASPAGLLTVTPYDVPYDGQPHSATAAATGATGTDLSGDFVLSGTTHTYPGTYADTWTFHDPSGDYVDAGGTLTDTITVTALVREGLTLNGDIFGSVQILGAQPDALNGDATLSGDLLVPGTPAVFLNGPVTYAGTLDGIGSASPNYSVTLNGKATLRHVVRRVDPIAMPAVSAPPAPAGNVNVSINQPDQAVPDFSTLNNLALNGNAGSLAVPPGTYGVFTVNGNATLVLGTANATIPAVYNLQGLTVNGNSQVQIVGPVVLTVATAVSANGSIGSQADPRWLTLRLSSGGLDLNGNVSFHGTVVAPAGNVTINGNATVLGEIVAQSLTVNGNGALQEPNH